MPPLSIRDILPDDKPLPDEAVAELHARFIAGDVAAGHVLFRSIARWLFVCGRDRYPRLPQDELFAESGLRAWRWLHRYDPARMRLSTWAVFSVRRGAQALREQAARERQLARGAVRVVGIDHVLVGEDREETGLPVVSREPDPARITERLDAYRWLTKALERIPPAEARIVRLRVEGRTFQEIGRMEAIDKRQACRLMDRARRRVHSLLDAAEPLQKRAF